MFGKVSAIAIQLLLLFGASEECIKGFRSGVSVEIPIPGNSRNGRSVDNLKFKLPVKMYFEDDEGNKAPLNLCRFQYYDQDDMGYITKGNIRNMLKTQSSDAVVINQVLQIIFAKLDIDEDGIVTAEEFNVMKGTVVSPESCKVEDDDVMKSD